MTCTECKLFQGSVECSTCRARLCHNPECIALHLSRRHPTKQRALWGAKA